MMKNAINCYKMITNVSKCYVLLSFVIICLTFVTLCNAANALETAGCAENHWEFPVNSFAEPRILHKFDRNLSTYAAGHRGLDLEAEPGTVVNAPENGKILWKGVVGGHPTVTMQIDDLKNTFTPMTTSFKVGDEVKKGEQFGEVTQNTDGTTHCSENNEGFEPQNVSCLHWGITPEDKVYYDPLAFVYKARIVLKGE